MNIKSNHACARAKGEEPGSRLQIMLELAGLRSLELTEHGRGAAVRTRL